jgi:hypothetical protein
MTAATDNISLYSERVVRCFCIIPFLPSTPSRREYQSICPQARELSTERINKIVYEPVCGMKFSAKGMIPFVRLDSEDGEEIADSNVVVLARLKAEQAAHVDTDAHLSLDSSKRP